MRTTKPFTEAESAGKPAELGFRMPAEWEPHAATWLAWPHASDWPGKSGAIPWVFNEMTRILTRAERVRVIVQDVAERRRVARELSRAGVDLSQVDFSCCPTDRSWTRDYLPLMVQRDTAAGGRRARGEGTPSLELGAVKWRFDGWARYANCRRDEACGRWVAEAMGGPVWRPAHPRAPRRRAVLEGGSICVDGEGTLLTTEECLLSHRRARYRGVSAVEVEQLLGEYLGVRKVLWLGTGIAGDDTSGHVDDFARFAGPGRVVLAQESRSGDENYVPLQQARERLEGARDAWGRAIEVVPLPMPDPVTFAGRRLPASYANFYVGNAAVLVPTFNDARDQTAIGILSEIFADREVIGVYCRDLVLGLGTLHCSTQQEPLGSRWAPGSTSGGRARAGSD